MGENYRVSNCSATLLEKYEALIKTTVEVKESKHKRKEKLTARVGSIIKGICAETTKNSQIRQCLNLSYPNKEEVKSFGKIPSMGVWFEAADDLLKKRLSNCKSRKQFNR